METKQARVVLAAMLVLGGMLVYALTATGGSLEPSAAPEPTMKTLQEIYDAVASEGSGVSQREGYCKYFDVSFGTTQTIFTVPAGKRFVVLKLLFHGLSDYWKMTVSDVTVINGLVNMDVTDHFAWDLPDRCIVAEPGDIVKIVNLHGAYSFQINVVGYSYDIP